MARRPGSWFLAGLGGALSMAGLFALDLVGTSAEFMGFDADARAAGIVIGRYGRQIIADQIKLLALLVAIGAVSGALGGWWLGRSDDGGVERPRRLVRIARGAGAALLVHAWCFALSIERYPQLYTEFLYDRGGARRSLMLLLTDPIGTFVVRAILLACLGWAVTRDPWVRRGRMRAPGAWLAIAGLAAFSLPLSWVPPRSTATSAPSTSANPARPEVAGRRPNVLLIAVDSLRADRVLAPKQASRFPTLATLAERAVRFHRAHVTVPRTFPSFVTLLTGRYPHHHGIRHMFPSAQERAAIGPALPGLLAEHGTTTSVVADYAGEIFSRTPLGFGRIDVPRFDMKTIVAQRGLEVHASALPYASSRLGERLFPVIRVLPQRADPRLVAERAISELHRIGDGPFFLTLFFSTPHFPYAAPSPYYRRFTRPDYLGPFRYQKPALVTRDVSGADIEQIRALYDGAVAAVDDALGRVLGELDALGLRDDTIVVLLSDHGENLYDPIDRGMGHGDHLEGSGTTHIPLLLVDPASPPRDVHALVRDVDLAPTLAARLGLALSATDGVDLGPLVRGEAHTLGLVAFSETELWFTSMGPGFMPDERLPYPTVTGVTDLAEDDDVFLRPEWRRTLLAAKHRSIETERWKLLYRPTRQGVRWALFDLVADPTERKDVLASHPEVAAELKAQLLGWITQDGQAVVRGDFVVPR